MLEGDEGRVTLDFELNRAHQCVHQYECHEVRYALLWHVNIFRIQCLHHGYALDAFAALQRPSVGNCGGNGVARAQVTSNLSCIRQITAQLTCTRSGRNER